LICLTASALLFLAMFIVLMAEGQCDPGTCDHGTITGWEIALGVAAGVFGVVELRLIGWEERHRGSH
jgi:hypothetical protein